MARLCMFPGQGSQFLGMGEALFLKYPHLVKASSDVLGYDVANMCLHSSAEQLANTEITQPMLYIVNALSYLKHVEETGIVPEFLAGHSLGEYSALFAAGCFDFITGLELVIERGKLMSTVKGGSMYAVIGLESAEIMDVLSANNNNELTIANYNSQAQTIIAGNTEDYNALKIIFSKAGAASFVKLNVSACFHTLHMKNSAEKYQEFLAQYRFSPLKIPVVSNITGHQYQTDDNIADALVKQIYSPVLWLHSMQYLLGKVGDDWKEVGPGNVLSKLAQHISQNSLVIS